MRRVTATVTLWLVDAIVLPTTVTPAAELPAHLLHPYAWVADVGTDAAAGQLAQTALFLTGLWLFAGLVSGALCWAPGGLGRIGQILAERTMPSALRALVVGSVAASVSMIPAAARAATTSVAACPVGAHTIGSGGFPRAALATPADARHTRPFGAPSTTSFRPAPGPTISPQSPVPWPTTASGRGGSGTRTAPPIGWPHDGPRSADRAVTVDAGDSLWVIAARRLGPSATTAATARSWPSWYRANHGVIGDDPDLILPGQRLQAPTERGAP